MRKQPLTQRAFIAILAGLSLLLTGCGFASGATASTQKPASQTTNTTTTTFDPMSKVWIGADVNIPNGNTLANFQASNAVIGPLRIRRSFQSATSIVSAVNADKAVGITSFVSLKPPQSDATLTAIAKALPAGTLFTINHEPENDMRGATFVTLYRHTYTVMKAANPGLRIGPVHLTYAWRNVAGVGSAGNNTGPLEPESAWDVGDAYRDFTGADNYSAKGSPLSTDVSYQHWYKYFLTASTKPLNLIEYGQVVQAPGTARDPAKEAYRATIIKQDAAWIRTQARIRMWLLWNGTGAQGNWSLQDAECQQVWRDIALAGRAA